MLAIEITLSVFVLFGMLCIAGLTGFLIRFAKYRLQKEKVAQLEQEMLEAHAQILELHSKLADLKSPSPKSAPVVSLKDKDLSETKFQDIAQRKK